jgi:hypothetical protein
MLFWQQADGNGRFPDMHVHHIMLGDVKLYFAIFHFIIEL